MHNTVRTFVLFSCIISRIAGLPAGYLPHPGVPPSLGSRSIFSEHPASPGSGSVTLPSLDGT